MELTVLPFSLRWNPNSRIVYAYPVLDPLQPVSKMFLVVNPREESPALLNIGDPLTIISLTIGPYIESLPMSQVVVVLSRIDVSVR